MQADKQRQQGLKHFRRRRVCNWQPPILVLPQQTMHGISLTDEPAVLEQPLAGHHNVSGDLQASYVCCCQTSNCCMIDRLRLAACLLHSYRVLALHIRSIAINTSLRPLPLPIPSIDAGLHRQSFTCICGWETAHIAAKPMVPSRQRSPVATRARLPASCPAGNNEG